MMTYLLIGVSVCGILGALAWEDEPTLTQWYALAKNTKGGWDL
jgi:hypothetical protein